MNSQDIGMEEWWKSLEARKRWWQRRWERALRELYPYICYDGWKYSVEISFHKKDNDRYYNVKSKSKKDLSD